MHAGENERKKEMQCRWKMSTPRTFLAVDKVEESGACNHRNQRKCNAHLGAFVVLQLLQHALHLDRQPTPHTEGYNSLYLSLSLSLRESQRDRSAPTHNPRNPPAKLKLGEANLKVRLLDTPRGLRSRHRTQQAASLESTSDPRAERHKPTYK